MSGKINSSYDFLYERPSHKPCAQKVGFNRDVGSFAGASEAPP